MTKISNNAEGLDFEIEQEVDRRINKRDRCDNIVLGVIISLVASSALTLEALRERWRYEEILKNCTALSQGMPINWWKFIHHAYAENIPLDGLQAINLYCKQTGGKPPFFSTEEYNVRAIPVIPEPVCIASSIQKAGEFGFQAIPNGVAREAFKILKATKGPTGCLADGVEASSGGEE